MKILCSAYFQKNSPHSLCQFFWFEFQNRFFLLFFGQKATQFHVMIIAMNFIFILLKIVAINVTRLDWYLMGVFLRDFEKRVEIFFIGLLKESLAEWWNWSFFIDIGLKVTS